MHLLADSVDAGVVNGGQWYDRHIKTYARSKLAQVMHAVALTKKIRSEDSTSKVTINACDPGNVYRELIHIPYIRRVLNPILAPITWFCMKSEEDGAQTAVYLTLGQQVHDICGKYFSDFRLAKVHQLAGDASACEKL